MTGCILFYVELHINKDIIMQNQNADSQNDLRHEGHSSREIWSILFLSSIFFLSYNGRAILGPLLPALEHDLDLSHAESGGLFIFLFTGYLVSLFGSALSASLIGHRRTIIISAVGVGAAMTAVAASDSLLALHIGLVVVGLGSGLYPPSGITVLTKLTKPSQWGKAIGIHDVAPNLSIVAVPAIAGILLNVTSWRAVCVFFGLTAILVGLAFVRFGPKETGRGQIPDLATLRLLLSQSSLWTVCILFILGGAGMVGVYNMLPLYLTSIHDFTQYSANMIVALSRVPGIGMALVAGLLSDRIGPRKVIAIVFACTGILNIIIGIGSGTVLITVIFIQAAVATCFFPAGLAAVSKLFVFELRSLAIAFIAAFSGCVGAGLVSALMGLLADNGMFREGLILNGIIVLTGLPILFFLKFTDKS